jgi:hypothetical protein
MEMIILVMCNIFNNFALPLTKGDVIAIALKPAQY